MLRRSLVSLALAALLAAVAIAQTASDQETYRSVPIRYLVEAAEQGDRVAMVTAAWRYEHGIGVPRHHERAAHWARAAAEHGSVLGAAWHAFLIGVEAGLFPRSPANIGLPFTHNAEHEHLYLEG